MRFAIAGLVVLLVCSTAWATASTCRSLTFEDRVKAQAAIERVYYSHQLGATKSFEDAVPKAVLEKKVRQYLEQTAALNAYWKTSVTDEMLQRELERMAQGTRMPERLVELYAALGNDSFLIKECLARATLVDRLTRNFYAFDSTMHGKAKAQAEELHRRLVAGELSPAAENVYRTVSELVVSETETGPAARETPHQQRMSSKELQRRRAELPARLGQGSDVKESRESFVFNVILSETSMSVRVASYVVPKMTWDAWWETTKLTLRSEAVTAVAAVLGPLTTTKDRLPTSSEACTPDDTWDNGTLLDVPDARTGHSAVWTGNVMVVWGGEGDIDPYLFNSGGRYDPATDAWTRTSMTGAPSARSGHAAFWTGNLMVVWGGGAGGRYDPASDSWTPMNAAGPPSCGNPVWTGNLMIVWGCGTGGRYDPASDSWTPMSMAGAPAGGTAAWAGDLMVVWDGSNNSGGRYDPATDSWIPMSTTGAPTPCHGHTAVSTGNLMLAWCGFERRGERSIGGRYDPVADTWTPMSNVGAHHVSGGYSAVWTGSLMVVWGGVVNHHFFDDAPTYDAGGGQYDPATDTWTDASGSLDGRAGHTAVWTGNLMVVWGGYSCHNDCQYYDTGGRYDPATHSWTPTSTGPTNAPSGRAYHSAVWTGSLMIAWGGYGEGTGGRYDPATDSWTPTSTTDAPVARSSPTSVWTGNLMVIWGGADEDYHRLESGGRYDPATDRWTPTSTTDAPSARDGHTAVWTGTLMVVWGGFGDPGGTLDTGGRYDPTTDSWRPTATAGAPSARHTPTAVWTGSSMVIWGGYFYQPSDGSGEVLSSGGRYDPITDTWTPTSTTDAPAARYRHTAVWTGNEMVVWGGLNFVPYYNDLDTGGRYDPATDSWTSTTTADAPSARSSHTAVWTGSLMVVWGGYGERTGGRYDPASDSWTPTSLFRAPSPRYGHTAVWTGSLMVVWGGYGNGHVFNTGGRYRVVTSPTADRDCDGLTAAEGDCDDTHATVYPVAPQICDGLNNDCNDPEWPAVPQNETNLDGDAFLLCAGDCDDTNPSTYPGARERCNAIDDNCDGIVDNGGDVLCYDGNTCTDDSCHGAYGCGYVSNSNACDDRNPCTSDDSCRNGYCAGSPLDCDDGNTCTNDWCDWDTGCVHEPIEEPCNDGNSCTDDSCVPATGCMYTANNNNACDDRNDCTVGDACRDGTCTPSAPAVCNDGNVCTSDSCDPNRGCFFTDITSSCNDHNPCTTDSCDPVTGCVFVIEGNPCTDGNPCTSGDWCNNGVCIPGTPEVCHDNNLCTTDSCDPARGCVFTNNTNPCSDGNACTKGDACWGGTCYPGALGVCNDFNPCTTDSCNRATGCVFTDNTVVCNDGNACTTFDTCVGGACNPGMPLECNDYNPCTTDSCNPATGCVFTNNTNACDDHLVCTEGDVCRGGVCRGTTLNCTDKNACTDDTCDPTAGCVHTNNTAPCSDRNECTRTDVCSAGLCVGGSPFGCDALDQCHEAGVCDPGTGACSNPNKAEGTACDDASLCTTGETCQSGACTPAFSGLNHPAPKSAGYYKKLCEKREHNQLPYQGDQLSDADAVCVGQLTSTFAGIATIDDICDVVHKDQHGGRHHGGPGDGPNGKDCDKGENELIATALNICRARVCVAQGLDSRCHGDTHATVSQALSDADTILDDAARDKDTCKSATCELREINNGHALEMNSLALTMEGGKVRLNWSSPVLDDGSGTPDSYELWRRPMGSNDAFVRLGTTTGITFLDTTSGTAAWEYDITPVIPGN